MRRSRRFVIPGDGFIVTNHHVVEGATRVDVRMSDGENGAETVLLADPANPRPAG